MQKRQLVAFRLFLSTFILSHVDEVCDCYLAFEKVGDDLQFASDSLDVGTETVSADFIASFVASTSGSSKPCTG